VITEDYVKNWKPDMSDANLSRISKLVSVISGVLAFGFVFIAETMGDIFPVNQPWLQTNFLATQTVNWLNSVFSFRVSFVF